MKFVVNLFKFIDTSCNISFFLCFESPKIILPTIAFLPTSSSWAHNKIAFWKVKCTYSTIYISVWKIQSFIVLLPSACMKLMTYLQTTHGLSRRAITELIKQQAILVNGQIVEWFGHLLTPGDQISRGDKKALFSGVTARQTTQHLVLFHKPCGYVVSKSDPHNATIFDLLPSWRSKSYYPIGRLDKDSSWLLLLSNDPKLVHELLHPSKKLPKVYHVLVRQERSAQHSALTKVWCLVNEHGESPTNKEKAELLQFAKISHHRTPQWPTLLNITLLEGKKRHIRRVLRYLGYTILSLQRIAFGSWQLWDLEEGKWQEVEDTNSTKG